MISAFLIERSPHLLFRCKCVYCKKRGFVWEDALRNASIVRITTDAHYFLPTKPPGNSTFPTLVGSIPSVWVFSYCRLVYISFLVTFLAHVLGGRLSQGCYPFIPHVSNFYFLVIAFKYTGYRSCIWRIIHSDVNANASNGQRADYKKLRGNEATRKRAVKFRERNKISADPPTEMQILMGEILFSYWVFFIKCTSSYFDSRGLLNFRSMWRMYRETGAMTGWAWL